MQPAPAPASPTPWRRFQPHPDYLYLYWGEIDAAGHRYGVGSDEWLQQLEELNSALKRLAERAPAWAALFVTADHGMVNVPRASAHRLFRRGGADPQHRNDRR